MDWQEEFFGIWFKDQRLTKRFFATLQSFSNRPGDTIKGACEHWSHVKATYRLLSNPGFCRFRIMQMHRDKTIQRMSEYPEVLALSDTSLLSYQGHLSTQGLGPIGTSNQHSRPSKGLITHNLIAVTPEGVPLGLLDQTTWARHQLKEKESQKWINSLESGSLQAQQELQGKTKVITVSDRESDVNDYLASAFEYGLDVIVRAMDRRVDLVTGKKLKESIEEDFASLGEYELDVTKKYQSRGENTYKRKTQRLKKPERKKSSCSSSSRYGFAQHKRKRTYADELRTCEAASSCCCSLRPDDRVDAIDDVKG